MPKFLIPVTGFLLVVMASPTVLAQENCFRHVKVMPLALGRNDIFIGKGNQVEVRFNNESGSSNVDVFPEPPMTITTKYSGRSCMIDGGVWVRNSVYLCPGERVLMVQEFSGSNDYLNFYDTARCIRTNKIDVSGGKWKVKGSELILEMSTKDGSTIVKEVDLRKACLPYPSDR